MCLCVVPTYVCIAVGNAVPGPVACGLACGLTLLWPCIYGCTPDWITPDQGYYISNLGPCICSLSVVYAYSIGADLSLSLLAHSLPLSLSHACESSACALSHGIRALQQSKGLGVKKKRAAHHQHLRFLKISTCVFCNQHLRF